MRTWLLLCVLILILVGSVLLNAWAGNVEKEYPVKKWNLWHCSRCLNAYKDMDSLGWHIRVVHATTFPNPSHSSHS